MHRKEWVQQGAAEFDDDHAKPQMLMRLMLLVGLSMLFVQQAGAQAPGKSKSSSERRIALVIGNNNYQYAPTLGNAVADARAMKREIEARGFKTVYRENANRTDMYNAIEEFLGMLSTDAVGMVYFSGHGVQIRSVNYLIPTDLKADKEADVLYNGFDLSNLMLRMTDIGARFSLVVIDACRDNPFHGRSIGGSKGLAAPSSNAVGLMIVYAAGAGQEALDSLGADDKDPNGLFTREFIRAMRKPGLNVQEVVSQTRLAVIQKADSIKHAQTPAVYDQSTGTFVFTEAGSVIKPVAPEPDRAPAGVGPSSAPPSAAPMRVDMNTVIAALSSADANALRSLTAASVPAATLEEALRQRSSDGKSSIARRFFENSTRSSDAVAWFDGALGAGLDPNVNIPSDYFEREGILHEAMRAGNVPATKALLRRGANPHAYQNLFLTTSPRVRFLYPLRIVADDDRLTLAEKQDLAKAFLDAGAVVPKALPPAGGSGWESTMMEVNELQEKAAPSLGMKLPPTPTLCERPAPPVCKQASKRSGEDWCAIVANTPKKLDFVFGKASTSPLYDVNLAYLLGIEGNRAYYLALTKSINWDYVVVEVSKDASSFTVLRMMSPEAGMGLCKKEDDGYQAMQCWRRIPLQRVPGTDEMRFASFGLSWKISKDSCASAPSK